MKLTDKQIDQCRDFLFGQGYGWSLCAFTTDSAVIAIMEENHVEVLESIKEGKWDD